MNTESSEKHKPPFEKIGILFYLVFIFSLLYKMGLEKRLWFDELSTWHLGFAHHFSQIWTGLINGADVLPPILFIVTRISGYIFGFNTFALRLPSVLAFLFFIFLIYRYTSNMSNKLAGLFAVLIGTLSLSFALEARPYAIILAFGTLAFISWSQATRLEKGGKRRFYILLMIFSLIITFLSHYYACILFIPIFFGEITRYLKSKKIDWPIILALFFSSLSYLLCIPLIFAASEYSKYFWTGRYLEFTPQSYALLVGQHEPNYMYIFVGLLVISYIIYKIRLHIVEKLFEENIDFLSQSKLKIHEKVAFIMLFLTPFYIYLLSFITNAFYPRYSTPIVIAESIVFALAFDKFSKKSRGTVIFIISTLIILNILVHTSNYRSYISDQKLLDSCMSSIERNATTTLPIVLTNSHMFTQVYHYASDDLKTRLVYPTSRQDELKYFNIDSDFRTLTAIAPIAKLPVISAPQFIKENTSFYLAERPRWINYYLKPKDPHTIIKISQTDCGRFY